MKHVSVLLHETVDSLNVKPDGIYVDGTLGRAGHAKYLISKLTTGHLYAFDKDEQALKESNLSEQVNVEANSRYVVLNMNGALLFDSGKADLKQEAISVLSGVADSIKQYDNYIISIEERTNIRRKR